VPDGDEKAVGNHMKILLKRFIWTATLGLSFSVSVASAQLTKLTVGYSSTASAELPAWLAKETGIFAKNDLDVQLVYFRGGTTATMALLSRQTPISQGSGQVIVNAGLRGADTVMIAGGLVNTEWWLMTRPDIKTAEQLKAGAVAISPFGGLAESMTRIALKRLGLTPVKDIAFVQVGGLQERVFALETGKVQGAMLPTPYKFIAQKRGFYNLLSVSLSYQSTGVSTTRTFIRDNPDIVRKYVRSQVEAMHRIKTDRETALKILMKYLGLKDKDILEKSYEELSSDEKFPPKQYPTLEGMKNILEPLAETDAKAKAAKPEDFIDMSFVKELDDSGFIADLYKSRKR
jgi:ABC-type nitrate/sulfonate/bicarbonate transport system substrate-binding protein